MAKSKKEYLFVDGYNIINAWKELKDISTISLEVARNRLIEIMAEYQAYTNIRVIIVFDAHLVKGSIEKKEKIYEIEVVYTKENETADGYIEKVLDSIGRHKKVRVATSDWAEQQIVLGRGGTRVSARELKIEIENIKAYIERKSKTKKKEEEIKNKLMNRLDKDIIKKLEKIRKN
ncbi:NYN domain-containing protein [Clostridiisalibacter paucivorans]|uniref:NYN domain-containing protein n=1 Tax=Clostridiisalibacter paucivorans TaxID=408753 RepID=UPI00047A054D|nr:NYN domain-containing protein [Clostridiisalibacter paucivorans]